MKKAAYYLIPFSILLVSCNAGSSGSNNSSTPVTNSQMSNSKISADFNGGSSYSRPYQPNAPTQTQYTGNILLTINNFSKTVINETVPDSDHLICLPSTTNCGASNSDLFTSIAPNASVSLTLQSQVDATLTTLSLEVYGNGNPLFAVWQDGAGTPNVYNHYNGKFQFTKEVTNWYQGGNNSSLFLAEASTNGLSENISWSTDQNNNVNVTININSFY